MPTKTFLNKFSYWFLCLRLVQWFHRLFTNGWCFVKKNDRRFFNVYERYCLPFEGDEKADPRNGPFTKDPIHWQTWICVQVDPKITYTFFTFLALDILFTGQRLANFKYLLLPGHKVCFRVGYHSGNVMLLVPNKVRCHQYPELQLVAQWQMLPNGQMPPEVAKLVGNAFFL